MSRGRLLFTRAERIQAVTNQSAADRAVSSTVGIFFKHEHALFSMRDFADCLCLQHSCFGCTCAPGSAYVAMRRARWTKQLAHLALFRYRPIFVTASYSQTLMFKNHCVQDSTKTNAAMELWNKAKLQKAEAERLKF